MTPMITAASPTTSPATHAKFRAGLFPSALATAGVFDAEGSELALALLEMALALLEMVFVLPEVMLVLLGMRLVLLDIILAEDDTEMGKADEVPVELLPVRQESSCPGTTMYSADE